MWFQLLVVRDNHHIKKFDESFTLSQHTVWLQDNYFNCLVNRLAGEYFSEANMHLQIFFL